VALRKVPRPSAERRSVGGADGRRHASHGRGQSAWDRSLLVTVTLVALLHYRHAADRASRNRACARTQSGRPHLVDPNALRPGETCSTLGTGEVVCARARLRPQRRRLGGGLRECPRPELSRRRIRQTTDSVRVTGIILAATGSHSGPEKAIDVLDAPAARSSPSFSVTPPELRLQQSWRRIIRSGSGESSSGETAWRSIPPNCFRLCRESVRSGQVESPRTARSSLNAIARKLEAAYRVRGTHAAPAHLHSPAIHDRRLASCPVALMKTFKFPSSKSTEWTTPPYDRSSSSLESTNSGYTLRRGRGLGPQRPLRPP
jgi:hypothetical protein